MTTKIKVLRVVAKKDSFRRAGHEFTAEPKDLPLASLHKNAHAAITSDPSLVSHEVEIDAPDEESAPTPVAKPKK